MASALAASIVPERAVIEMARPASRRPLPLMSSVVSSWPFPLTSSPGSMIPVHVQVFVEAENVVLVDIFARHTRDEVISNQRRHVAGTGDDDPAGAGKAIAEILVRSGAIERQEGERIFFGLHREGFGCGEVVLDAQAEIGERDVDNVRRDRQRDLVAGCRIDERRCEPGCRVGDRSIRRGGIERDASEDFLFGWRSSDRGVREVFDRVSEVGERETEIGKVGRSCIGNTALHDVVFDANVAGSRMRDVDRVDEPRDFVVGDVCIGHISAGDAVSRVAGVDSQTANDVIIGERDDIGARCGRVRQLRQDNAIIDCEASGAIRVVVAERTERKPLGDSVRRTSEVVVDRI